MANIVEEKVVVKVSRIVKSGVEAPKVVTDEIIQALEMMSEQLFGDAAVVEVTTVDA